MHSSKTTENTSFVLSPSPQPPSSLHSPTFYQHSNPGPSSFLIWIENKRTQVARYLKSFIALSIGLSVSVRPWNAVVVRGQWTSSCLSALGQQKAFTRSFILYQKFWRHVLLSHQQLIARSRRHLEKLSALRCSRDYLHFIKQNFNTVLIKARHGPCDQPASFCFVKNTF